MNSTSTKSNHSIPCPRQKQRPISNYRSTPNPHPKSRPTSHIPPKIFPTCSLHGALSLQIFQVGPLNPEDNPNNSFSIGYCLKCSHQYDKTESLLVFITTADIRPTILRHLKLNLVSNCYCADYVFSGRCGHLYYTSYKCGKTVDAEGKKKWCEEEVVAYYVDNHVLEIDCSLDGCRLT